MAGHLRAGTLDRNLLVRQCVACGYDGALLRGGHAVRCARCGCDLRDRPARSYAEMEGLLGEIDAAVAPVVPMPPLLDEPTPGALLCRWLAFLTFVLVGMVAVAMMVAGSLP